MAKRTRTGKVAPEDHHPSWIDAGVSVLPEVVVEEPPNAAMEAFEQIADICGCRTWDYPGQLVRDVRALADERDGLRLQLDLLRDEARQLQIERDSLRKELEPKTPPNVGSQVLEAIRKNPDISPAALVEGLVVPGGHPRSRLRSELLNLICEDKVVFTMERTLRIKE